MQLSEEKNRNHQEHCLGCDSMLHTRDLIGVDSFTAGGHREEIPSPPNSLKEMQSFQKVPFSPCVFFKGPEFPKGLVISGDPTSDTLKRLAFQKEN